MKSFARIDDIASRLLEKSFSCLHCYSPWTVCFGVYQVAVISGSAPTDWFQRRLHNTICTDFMQTFLLLFCRHAKNDIYTRLHRNSIVRIKLFSCLHPSPKRSHSAMLELHNFYHSISVWVNKTRHTKHHNPWIALLRVKLSNNPAMHKAHRFGCETNISNAIGSAMKLR